MNILVVEDNQLQQEIMKEAFVEANSSCVLHMVNDGVEAIQFLKREGEFINVPEPNLIILDLNLPRKNGREVLHEIKSDPLKAHIPILIFSNSETQEDICTCYRLRANAYLNKPYEFQEFVTLVKLIDSFWIKSIQYCTL